MVSNRLAFAALGFACVTAAAGGSYLATRHNVAEQVIQPASAASEVAVPAAEATPPTSAAATPESILSPTADPTPSTPARTAPAPRQAQPARQVRRAVPPTVPVPAARPEPAATTVEHAPAVVAPAPVGVDAPAVAHTDERPAEPLREFVPAASPFEELTVAADSVIGLETETTLTSERARVEDRVEARVVRDVRVSGHVAIPAGSRVLGSVVLVERGGKMRDRARLGIRFHTLALSDGTRVPITTETIYRFGDAPGDNSAKKIGGGAVAGAILGAIIGGGKGAAIGATTGAAGGSAAVMAGERSQAVFQSGAQITARILSPITVTVDR